MRILKTLVQLDDGSVHRCDTMLAGDRKWVVKTGEIVDRFAGSRKSWSLMRFDQLRYRIAAPDWGADFLLEDIVPRNVWEGRTTNLRFVFEDWGSRRKPGGMGRNANTD